MPSRRHLITDAGVNMSLQGKNVLDDSTIAVPLANSAINLCNELSKELSERTNGVIVDVSRLICF